MASNSYTNNVVVNGETILDLRSDTVAASYLANGYTAHDKSGAVVTGTAALTYNSSTEELSMPDWAVTTCEITGDRKAIVSDAAVRFFDYDGSVVTEWDRSEVAGRSALPSNPSHTGLVAQGWNWTLADIKEYVAKYSTAVVNVGQMYKTASGLTEIDITVTTVTGLTVTCNMVGNKNWGDGTSDALTTHTYSTYGSYTITCDGTEMPSGTSSSGGVFSSSTSNKNRYWCTNIRIGDGVTSLGSYTFNNCFSLRSVTIPNSVTRIVDNYTFYNCYSLISVTIPDGVTSIYGSSFMYCRSLRSVMIPEGVTSIGPGAFCYCGSLTNVTIPDSVTSIGGGNAFCYCYSLTNITIPNDVTSIGNSSTFTSCESLSRVTIPDGVTRIGDSTFGYCRALTSVKLPGSVTSIGSYAFQFCAAITDYDFTSATSVPTLANTNAFTYINGLCKIRVPLALEESWKTATNWSTYADYIYGE